MKTRETYSISELLEYSRDHGYIAETASLQAHLEKREAMKTASVKDDAATVAQDAASHGYNGRNGKAAQLLKECARAVRIAASKLATYGVPVLGADERAEYAADLAARLIGDNGGYVPTEHVLSYMVKRAQGIIMNDRGRRGVDLSEPAESEAGKDPRLTGPLSIPADVEAIADALPLTETGRRALFAAMVPATRKEWAEFYGYANAQSWHVTANRGRAELFSIGEGPLRAAIAKIVGDVDPAAELAAIMEGI